MTAHVRKGFINALNNRGLTTADNWPVEYEDYFRAGVRFQQARHKATYYEYDRRISLRHETVRQALATALEILSRTPAGKREADKLREVLK